MITGGWKEAGDFVGAVRFLRTTSPAPLPVAVIGFSDGGRSLVKAMEGEGAADIAAGIAVRVRWPTTPMTPRPPGTTVTPLGLFFLDFLGTSPGYQPTMAPPGPTASTSAREARTVADTDIAQVKAPLLLLYATDDMSWLGH